MNERIRNHLLPKPRVISLLLPVLLIAGICGCQQQTVGKLLGRWIGRPDTAVARATRESQKYGDDDTTSTAIEGITTRDDANDWQRYDVSIEMEFVDRDHVKMSLAGGAEPRSGAWKILETSPTGCTIEITTDAPPSADPTTATPSAERRRFLIELDERDDICVGFLLTEVGADRQLGALYFHRPDDSAN